MKALVYTGPGGLDYCDMPDAAPRDGEDLVRILRSGICGSDMHAYLGHDARRPAPLILGHEAAGTVTGGPRDGLRVTINPLVTCGTCRACRAGRENLCPGRQIISMPPREGAFAEWVAMPPANLVAIPDHMSITTAALAEPLAVSWHAAKLALAALPAPENGLILGGGAIGVGAALALQAMGLRDLTLVEPNTARRAFLADHLPGVTLRDAADGSLFDLVIDAVGYAATRATASALCHPGGVITHIGLGEGTGGLDIRRMTLQEITFIGTYTYAAQDFRDTVAAMADGRLGALGWAETRALSDGAAAFADIRAGRTPAPKIILCPNETE